MFIGTLAIGTLVIGTFTARSISVKNFFGYALGGLISLICIIGIITYDIKLAESNFKFITMIIASLIVFNLVLWIILRTREFMNKLNQIILLSMVCVVIGMLLGKFGAAFGLKWWIYYPVPVMINLFLPPLILKLNKKQILTYLLLSLISAPFIHVIFSFFFNWTEYMPFLHIPFFKTIL